MDEPRSPLSFQHDPSSWEWCREHGRHLNEQLLENTAVVLGTVPSLNHSAQDDGGTQNFINAASEETSLNQPSLQSNGSPSTCTPCQNTSSRFQNHSLRDIGTPSPAELDDSPSYQPKLLVDAEPLLPFSSISYPTPEPEKLQTISTGFHCLLRFSYSRMTAVIVFVCALVVAPGVVLGLVTGSVGNGAGLAAAIAAAAAVSIQLYTTGVRKLKLHSCRTDVEEKEMLV